MYNLSINQDDRQEFVTSKRQSNDCYSIVSVKEIFRKQRQLGEKIN